MSNINFAIIGMGHIGCRHAAMIEECSGATLVAIADTLPEKQILTTEKVRFFLDIDSLLGAADALQLDVLVVATANGLHETHALQALQAGLHVVVEKPMALSKAGCERIIFKALQRQRQVFCVMQNRYSPISQWLKEVVEQGVLGKIWLIQTNCYWNRDDRYYQPNSWHGKKDLDGGTLFTQFSHFIDLLYWCFGDVKNIQSRFANFTHQHSTDFEDSGFVTFGLTDHEKAMGTFNFSTAVWDKNLESSMTIIAQNGTIKVSGQYMERVEYCHIKDYKMPILPISSVNNHLLVIQNVVAVLQGKKTIDTNALEGLKVVEIIERIYQ